MNEYLVEHIQSKHGGYDDRILVSQKVRARTALDAILEIAPTEHVATWTRNGVGDEEAAGLLNPDAPNESDRYCDYWFSKRAT